MSNIISNNSLKNFSSTLTLFSNYIIKHNLIPTFSQYNIFIQTNNAPNLNINLPYYYNLHLYNILHPTLNPIPELYKLHLNKIKINNYKTPPNFQFTPNNI